MIAAIDGGLTLALTLHEIQSSPVTPRVGMELLEQGGMHIEIHAATDAMNRFSPLFKPNVQEPQWKDLCCVNCFGSGNW